MFSLTTTTTLFYDDYHQSVNPFYIRFHTYYHHLNFFSKKMFFFCSKYSYHQQLSVETIINDDSMQSSSHDSIPKSIVGEVDDYKVFSNDDFDEIFCFDENLCNDLIILFLFIFLIGDFFSGSLLITASLEDDDNSIESDFDVNLGVNIDDIIGDIDDFFTVLP